MRWLTQPPQAVCGSNVSGLDCTAQPTTARAAPYQPVVADPEDLLLMRLLDEQYLLTPFYGYRKMRLVLTQAGYLVNHKRQGRLCGT